MSTKVHISIPQERLAAYCRRNRIQRLALFGSVLRDDFRSDSDVDVLVEFEPGAKLDYEQLQGMKEELERLLGRSVDLVERQRIEASENYIRRKHILTHLETVYVAG